MPLGSKLGMGIFSFGAPMEGKGMPCFFFLFSGSSFCHLFKPITINTTLTRLFQDATMFEFKRVPLLPNSTFKFLMSEQNLILLGLGIWLGAISVVLFF